MAKKLISVWLSLTILLFSTITIYADEDVQGHFLNRNIDINGNRIANYNLEDPFFLYQGTTYFPINEEIGELLGFAAEMDWESRTLKILKKEPIKTKLDVEELKCNLINPTATVVKDVTVLALAEEKRNPDLPVKLQGVQYAANEIDIGGQLEESEEDIIPIPELVVENVDISQYEVLIVDDTLCLPLRILTENSCFGWDIYYDDYSGIYISTEPNISAYNYFDKAESDYNKGLANYIMSKNSSVNRGKALMLVFLFKHEADVNDIDEILLMAMAHKESTFRTDAVGGKAIGLMQIMPSTAELYGIPRNQLFDPHVNIEFGAKYIGDKLDQYDDKTIALSAYNQGGAAISRGSYTTRYAGRINDAERSIRNYLSQNGYVEK